MANKLKNIFSNDPPEYKSTVRFQSNDAYRNFRAALDAVERDGSVIPVDGIESVLCTMPEHFTTQEVEEMSRLTNIKYDTRIEQRKSGEKQWDTNVSIIMVLRGIK